MKKIRIGNDFVFNWAIERGGLPEDLSSVLEKHLHLSVFGKRVELIEGVDYDITGNVIRIEVTPTIANIIGTYNAEFHYILPDNGLIDEDRKCAVDVDAFQIVARTAQADDPSEFTVTSDMAIAFKGDKGDSAYQVWLEEGNTGTEEDYFAYLRQPAIDAAQSANEAAGLADTARTELTTAVNTKLGEADTKIEEMDTTLSTYNGRVTQVESDITQLAGDASVKIANLIVNGDFSNGSTGWMIISPSVITINNKIIFNGLAPNNNGVYTDIPVVGNAKLYLTYKASNEGIPFPNIRLFNYNSFDNSTNTNFSQTVSSGVFDSLLGGVRIYFRQSSGTTYINATYDNIMLINLTSIFGAGNEPTKEEVDLLISTLGIDYFEGEITIPAQKVMQWQLKMIRQNKNAIIALGGTII